MNAYKTLHDSVIIKQNESRIDYYAPRDDPGITVLVQPRAQEPGLDRGNLRFYHANSYPHEVPQLIEIVQHLLEDLLPTHARITPDSLEIHYSAMDIPVIRPRLDELAVAHRAKVIFMTN